MERSFQAELVARAADTPVPIGRETAELTVSQHTEHYAERCFGSLWERITREQPDLLA
jgi:hypothetical protein